MIMEFPKESVTAPDCTVKFLDQVVYELNNTEKYANIALVTLDQDSGRIYSTNTTKRVLDDKAISRRHVFYVLEGEGAINMAGYESKVEIRPGLAFVIKGNSVLEMTKHEYSKHLKLLCMDDPCWYDDKKEEKEIKGIDKKDMAPIDDICGELREIYYSDDMSLAHIPIKSQKSGGVHKHKKLNELYYVVSGQGKLAIGGDLHDLNKDGLVRIPLMKFHSAANPHKQDLELLVICYPKFDPADILRNGDV